MEFETQVEALVHADEQERVPASSGLGGRGVQASSLLCASVLLVAGVGAVWWRGDQGISTRGVIGRTAIESAYGIADSSCSRNGESCRHSRCCLKAGSQCYRKDHHWSSCNESCTPNKNWVRGE